jgi:hypothetical protein
MQPRLLAKDQQADEKVHFVRVLKGRGFKPRRKSSKISGGFRRGGKFGCRKDATVMALCSLQLPKCLNETFSKLFIPPGPA